MHVANWFHNKVKQANHTFVHNHSQWRAQAGWHIGSCWFQFHRHANSPHPTIPQETIKRKRRKKKGSTQGLKRKLFWNDILALSSRAFEYNYCHKTKHYNWIQFWWSVCAAIIDAPIYCIFNVTYHLDLNWNYYIDIIKKNQCNKVTTNLAMR